MSFLRFVNFGYFKCEFSRPSRTYSNHTYTFAINDKCRSCESQHYNLMMFRWKRTWSLYFNFWNDTVLIVTVGLELSTILALWYSSLVWFLWSSFQMCWMLFLCSKLILKHIHWDGNRPYQVVAVYYLNICSHSLAQLITDGVHHPTQ